MSTAASTSTTRMIVDCQYARLARITPAPRRLRRSRRAQAGTAGQIATRTPRGAWRGGGGPRSATAVSTASAASPVDVSEDEVERREDGDDVGQVDAAHDPRDH